MSDACECCRVRDETVAFIESADVPLCRKCAVELAAIDQAEGVAVQEERDPADWWKR